MQSKKLNFTGAAAADAAAPLSEDIMNIPKISKRLEAAASFARQGSRIADVGTDHAYLPIYLHACGVISGGVASDINQGPTDRARMNVRVWGAEEAIDVLRADGLSGIEQYAPDDIFILGMGGELIVRIISEAPWIKEGKRLVLQPMTHPEILRAYLYENGFSIIDEALVEDEKIYQMICAEYTGERESADTAELMFGKRNIERGGELFARLLRRTREVYLGRVIGKARAGADDGEEMALIEKIDQMLNGGCKK